MNKRADIVSVPIILKFSSYVREISAEKGGHTAWSRQNQKSVQVALIACLQCFSDCTKTSPSSEICGTAPFSGSSCIKDDEVEAKPDPVYA